MNGVMLTGPHSIEVRQVEDAQMEQPTDVLMRVTSSAICGSDLHFYDGRLGDASPDSPLLIGHEPLGVVEEAGSAVISVKKGDRIVVPTHICCGFCANCVRGYSASCLTTNPGSTGAAYGYPGMGTYRGAQARYVRVPLADANCLKLPGEPKDALENDFVLLADALPTGYHATELVGVSPGDTVAIFGAGAIGLLAAYCARIRGASEIYVVDFIPERLEKAAELGATPIDFRKEDPVEQIRAARKKLRKDPIWKDVEAMGGVMCGIDAVGFQARDREDPQNENPNWVVDALARLINPTGRIAIIGVFPPKDPQGTDRLEQAGKLAVPWGMFFKKSVSLRLGRDDDERYNTLLRNMIVSGTIKPSKIVSHRLPMFDAPEAYRRFDRREDGYIKVVLDVG
jgi:glutathione-independent formaldehyde dehydrogenase